MKYILLACIFTFFLFTSSLRAQTENEPEKLGLPGDNLNLYAVMKLFQESPTLEGFEEKLNAEDSKINNLDLNGDDETDYIKVSDDVDGSVHTIILQVAISDKENQDVAVFTVAKGDDGNVDIQLTGDEELYGKDYIVEPNTTEGGTPNPGYTGNDANAQTRTLDDKKIVVNSFPATEIRTWPIVEFIFVPSYAVWRSPWYWGHYPGWWRPWRPLYWDFYFGYHYNYYNYYWGWYRRWPTHRYPYWNNFYFSRRRVYSPLVYNRRQQGLYRNTYSRPDLRKDGLAQYNKMHPNRPVLRPGLNKPAPRPVVRPVTPGVTRPGVKPAKPITRPVTRPVTPTKPGVTRPVVKPTRPVTRPVTPGNGNTRPAKPIVRPTKPVVRPTPKPLPTKPAITPRPAPRTQKQ